MRLVVTPKGDDGETVGFELQGPFSLEGPGELPVARIAYTQIRGSERGTVTVVSTGREAYVEVNGQAYELPPEQAARLRQAGQELEQGEGLGELGVDDWIQEPELSDGGAVGGTETDRIDAKLDVSAAAQDLVELGRGLGQGSLERLSDADEQTIERATRSARLQLFTGKEDRLLRRLDIDVDLGFDVPSDLRTALGSLVGARIDFELSVDDPNRPVKVEEPQAFAPTRSFRGRNARTLACCGCAEGRFCSLSRPRRLSCPAVRRPRSPSSASRFPPALDPRPPALHPASSSRSSRRRRTSRTARAGGWGPRTGPAATPRDAANPRSTGA